MTSKIFTINHVIGNTKLTSPLEKVIKSLHMLKLWDKEMEKTQIMLKLWDKEMERTQTSEIAAKQLVPTLN